MKQQVKFVVACMTVLLLNLMAGPAFGQVRNYDVLLTPQGATGTLGVHLGFGQSCAVNPHYGCMNFEVDTVGAITFRVAGNPARLTCGDPANPSSQDADKVITRIEVTDRPSGSSGTSQKGDFSGPLAGTWLKTYAFPQVDQNTGILYDVPVNNGLTHLTLVNLNSHPQADGIKSFWYRVTVTDCDDPTRSWVSDPRGDNQGSR